MKVKNLILPTLLVGTLVLTPNIYARGGDGSGTTAQTQVGQYGTGTGTAMEGTAGASPMTQVRERTAVMQENRENMNEEIEAKRAEMREAIANRHEELKQLAEEKKSELKEKAQAMTQEHRDEMVEKAQAKKEEMKAKMEEKAMQARSDMAARHATRLENRFSQYTERLTQLANKFQERVELMAADDLDVEAAQAKINEAYGLLEIATEQADGAVAMFTEIDPANYEAQRQVSQQAAEQAKQAREQYKEILSTLKEALQLMKGIQE